MAQKWAVKFARLQEKLEFDSERENFQLQGNNRPLITQKEFFIQLQYFQSTLYNKGSCASKDIMH